MESFQFTVWLWCIYWSVNTFDPELITDFIKYVIFEFASIVCEHLWTASKYWVNMVHVCFDYRFGRSIQNCHCHSITGLQIDHCKAISITFRWYWWYRSYNVHANKLHRSFRCGESTKLCISSGLVLKYAFTAVLAMEKYFFLHIQPIVTSLQCIIRSPWTVVTISVASLYQQWIS